MRWTHYAIDLVIFEKNDLFQYRQRCYISNLPLHIDRGNATAAGDRSKHCRSVPPWPNRNQSYDPIIVRCSVTVASAKCLRSIPAEISWMLLSLSFPRTRPECVQLSCIYRGCCCRCPSRERDPSASSCLVYLVDVVVVVLHENATRVRPVVLYISWMLLSLSFTRTRPECVQLSCISRGCCCRCPSRERNPSASSCLVYLVDVVVVVLHENATRVRPVVLYISWMLLSLSFTRTRPECVQLSCICRGCCCRCPSRERDPSASSCLVYLVDVVVVVLHENATRVRAVVLYISWMLLSLSFPRTRPECVQLSCISRGCCCRCPSRERDPSASSCLVYFVDVVVVVLHENATRVLPVVLYISWMLLSLSFTRTRPECVQLSCIFRGCCCRCPSRERDPSASSCLVYLVDVVVVVLHENATRVRPVVL